jgi:hypothetical protein
MDGTKQRKLDQDLREAAHRRCQEQAILGFSSGIASPTQSTDEGELE